MKQSFNQSDISYIAGIFDGEGSIYIISNYKRRQNSLVACITNTNKSVLLWIKSIMGGNIGSIPTVKKKNKSLPVYNLRWYSRNAMTFLETIKPYLRIKKTKAILAIEFQSKMKNGIRTMSNEEQLLYKEKIKSA